MTPNQPPELEDIPGIGPKRAQSFRDAGYESIADLQRTKEAELLAVEGIDEILAHDIKATVRPSRETPSPKPTMNQITPNDWQVTERQASHLARIANVSIEELSNLRAADIADKLEWRVDPELLLFQRVCGRVVKRDATTDELLPVPNATVHVEDTDCDFFGYFPDDSPWGWFLPYACSREEIATVTTDTCGRFCVLIPRWDIDRILRLREDRVCLPEIVDPSIRDILENLDLLPEPPLVRPPRPQPDPVPFQLREPGTYDQLKGVIGEERTERLFALTAEMSFGDSIRDIEELLDERAIIEQIDPPTPDDLLEGVSKTKGTIRNRSLAVDRDSISNLELDPNNFIGPFLRCRDITIPEWVSVLDVPDITFRVTQDVDGDMDEETIYSEGYFDVRWDDLPESELVLEADEIAISAPTCEQVPSIPDCETPQLRLLGAMPLASTYHSNDSPREGYALRVNRPRPGSDDAATPYAGRLNLYGCGFRNQDASYYRLVYRYRGSPSDSPTTAQPFTGIDWNAVRENWPPIMEHIQPVDDEGWYPIPDPDVLADRFQNLLLHWNTRHDHPNDNGLYDIRLELADGSKNTLEDETSDWLTIRVDNTKPSVRFDGLEWRAVNGPESGTLDLICPVLRRPLDEFGNPKTVEIDVSYTVQHPHLRNLNLNAYGCGGDSPTKSGPADDFSFWYDDPSDTYYSRNNATFRVQGGTESDGRLMSGGYTIELSAWSRAFNPTRATAGIDHDWEINPSHVGRHDRLRIAIVNGE